MSQGTKDKCLRSLVMSGDRSPAGMISAAVIDSLPPALRQAGEHTLRHTQLDVLKHFEREAKKGPQMLTTVLRHTYFYGGVQLSQYSAKVLDTSHAYIVIYHATPLGCQIYSAPRLQTYS